MSVYLALVFDKGGLLADILQYVNLPIMSRADCDECMDLRDGMVCAGVCGRNEADSCQVRVR